jgi:predicted transcriptional regulator
MRKYRRSLEIVADILAAVSLHSSKTGILEAANLNCYNVNKYLEIALRAGFLVVTDQKYEITSKGKEFLEKHGELTGNLKEFKSSLEKLKEERRNLESALVNQVNRKVTQEKIPVEQKDTQLIPTIVFKRINPIEFYGELTNLGFTTSAAMKIISWIDLIYTKNKFLFSGKKACLIKACLACNGAIILGAPDNVSRRVISRFFKVSTVSIQRSFKDYRRFILQEKADLIK